MFGLIRGVFMIGGFQNPLEVSVMIMNSRSPILDISMLKGFGYLLPTLGTFQVDKKAIQVQIVQMFVGNRQRSISLHQSGVGHHRDPSDPGWYFGVHCCLPLSVELPFNVDQG